MSCFWWLSGKHTAVQETQVHPGVELLLEESLTHPVCLKSRSSVGGKTDMIEVTKQKIVNWRFIVSCSQEPDRPPSSRHPAVKTEQFSAKKAGMVGPAYGSAGKRPVLQRRLDGLFEVEVWSHLPEESSDAHTIFLAAFAGWCRYQDCNGCCRCTRLQLRHWHFPMPEHTRAN